jgi:hypothetical protein
MGYKVNVLIDSCWMENITEHDPVDEKIRLADNEMLII